MNATNRVRFQDGKEGTVVTSFGSMLVILPDGKDDIDNDAVDAEDSTVEYLYQNG